jgi:hypothetical protein
MKIKDILLGCPAISRLARGFYEDPVWLHCRLSSDSDLSPGRVSFVVVGRRSAIWAVFHGSYPIVWRTRRDFAGILGWHLGYLIGVIEISFPRGIRYWIAAFFFGAILPTLVALLVVFSLKGRPMAGGWQPALLATAFMINGIWGYWHWADP